MATKKKTDTEKKKDEKAKKPTRAKSTSAKAAPKKKASTRKTTARGASRRTKKDEEAPVDAATPEEATSDVVEAQGEEEAKPAKKPARRATKRTKKTADVVESKDAVEAVVEEKPKRTRRASAKKEPKAKEAVAETAPVEAIETASVEAVETAPVEAVTSDESDDVVVEEVVEAEVVAAKTEEVAAVEAVEEPVVEEVKPKPVLRPAQYQKKGRLWLEALFAQMNLDVTPKAHYDKQTKTLSFDLTGKERNVLLGRNQASPKTIESIERLLLDALDLQDTKYALHLDVDSFRITRTAVLEALAGQMAQKSLDTQRAFLVAGLNDFERRVVHRALTDRKDIKTESEGVGTFRKIRIIPIKPAKVAQPEEGQA